MLAQITYASCFRPGYTSRSQRRRPSQVCLRQKQSSTEQKKKKRHCCVGRGRTNSSVCVCVCTLWFNPTIQVGTVTVYWKHWHLSCKRTIGDLYKNGQFMSNEELRCQCKLKGKQYFWRYLQIWNCLKSEIGNFSGMPLECCTASQFYILTDFTVS